MRNTKTIAHEPFSESQAARVNQIARLERLRAIRKATRIAKSVFEGHYRLGVFLQRLNDNSAHAPQNKRHGRD
jgi:hypothetical protein